MQERNERTQESTHIDSSIDGAGTLLAMRQAVAARLDTIAQMLFTAGLIADVLPRLWERDPQEGFTRLAELRQLTLCALGDVRDLLAELRSSRSDEVEREDAASNSAC
jgi:signal transduction histidine kinase